MSSRFLRVHSPTQNAQGLQQSALTLVALLQLGYYEEIKNWAVVSSVIPDRDALDL
jgi:hypothetical protein